jgi:hypothetical protein
MTLQPGDLLAITRPAGPQAGTYQLPAAALAELAGPIPVLGISGVLWSTVRSAADNSWQAICWSPELQLYVCVANSGSGNRVMTSSAGAPNRRPLIRTGWRSAGPLRWGCLSPSATAARASG